MNNELATKLAQAITARDELTAAIERAQKPADEWPKVGDMYFFLDIEGNVHSIEFGGYTFDRNCLARGNVYRTQAAAERADQRRIVEAELRRMAREAGPVSGAEAYEIRRGSKGWAPFLVERSGMPRFPTRESAEAAIATITTARLDVLRDEEA